MGGEERRGEEKRGRIVTRLRRLNITVNRARSNSAAGAGATRKHLSRWRDWGGARPGPFPVGRKGGRKTRWGGSTRRNGGFLSLRGTERTKLSQNGSLRRLNPFRLIPDRRELKAATTIVSPKTCPRSNAVGCLIIYEFRKYRQKLYRKAIVITKDRNPKI